MTLYELCQRYVSSTDWYENHPEDPYGDAELEYVEDMLRERLAKP